jgi:hypothetical protein
MVGFGDTKDTRSWLRYIPRFDLDILSKYNAQRYLPLHVRP